MTTAPTATQRARQWAHSHLPSQPPRLQRRARETASILQSLDLDRLEIEVGYLQSFAPLPESTRDAFINEFGETAWELFTGVERIRKLSALSKHAADNAPLNEENLRKMLITMIDDARVVLIKLADQLSMLRGAKKSAAEEQRHLADLTLDIFAPLANRLGIWQLKWEMEDFALRYRHPKTYRKLAAQLREKRDARETYIAEFIKVLQRAMRAADMPNCDIHGRPKHIYSIWKKMQNKGVAFDNLWDIRAVRILVDSVAECYAALGVVHTNWRHLPGEFDDYIATPKENNYRSIHSVVIGPEEKSVEVQIRTRDMHAENELGVAAHWRYKERGVKDGGIDDKVLWLRQLLEWRDQLMRDDSPAVLRDAFEDKRVYVFTPKGRVIDLPHGATPIDFAYAIHSEVGHRTRGARVNGKMVGLNRVLQSGDQVQIQTVKNAKPSRDWLRADLAYVKTRRARNRIHNWFKREDHDQHAAEGRAMLERELHRLGLGDLSYDKIAERTYFRKTEDLLAALGAGDFKLSKALHPFKPSDAPEVAPEVGVKRARRAPRKRARDDSFRVHGVGNLLTHMAKCCRPVPGDAIVGFITLGRGVTIHRQSCGNMRDLNDEQLQRLIEVEWGARETPAYPVNITLKAYQRGGLLHDVTQTLKDNKLDALSLNMRGDDELFAFIELQLEVADLQQLSGVINQLQRIPNVLSVARADQ